MKGHFYRALVIFLMMMLVVNCGGGETSPEPPKPELVGLADFHTHQFGYLGFGGQILSHSTDPNETCFAIPNFDASTLRIKDIVRSVLFGEAKWQAEKAEPGHCYPTATNLTSQRMATDNLRRAWQYGLRLIVMFAVSNEFLCKVAELATPCPSDRESIDIQIQHAKDLEAKIAREEGGWYKIVYTPQEAREAINQNKLAVVLGVETSNAFGGCYFESRAWTFPPLNSDQPREKIWFLNCDRLSHPLKTQQALALFEHYWKIGVRHFYPIHNMDGVAGGAGLFNPTLHGWNNPSGLEPADVGNIAQQIDGLVRAVRPGVSRRKCEAISEFDGGVCNILGLSDTGVYLVQKMASYGALIDIDHMSLQSKVDLRTKTLFASYPYPFVSSHSGINRLNHGNQKNEAQLSDSDIEWLITHRGVIAPILPPVGMVTEEDTYLATQYMQPKEKLLPNQSITSPNGLYTFIYQSDGNLVLYRNKDGKPLWDSKTAGRPAGVSIMQSDGNLVIYGPSNEYIWDTATGGHPGSTLAIQDDGNVVVYDVRRKALWATNTNDQTSVTAEHQCGGTSESWVQAYRYVVDKIREENDKYKQKYGSISDTHLYYNGVGFGTDFSSPVPVAAGPRFEGDVHVTAETTGNFFGTDYIYALFTPHPSMHHDWPCYKVLGSSTDGAPQPHVSYPFRSHMPLPEDMEFKNPFKDMEFPKSQTLWGHPSKEYDISFDGVVHVGMIPDFVEELYALGLTDADLKPLWHGAEAYVRMWEYAMNWKDFFAPLGYNEVAEVCIALREQRLLNKDLSKLPEDKNLEREMELLLERLQRKGCDGFSDRWGHTGPSTGIGALYSYGIYTTPYITVAAGFSETYPFTVHNRGSTPITVTGIRIEGDPTHALSLQNFSSPTIIPPNNGSASFFLEFHPAEPGEFEATVVILSDEPGLPELPLRFVTQVEPPPFFLHPSDTLEFGSVTRGSSSTMEVEIFNNLYTTNFSVSTTIEKALTIPPSPEGQFSLAPGSSGTQQVPPRASMKFQIEYAPTVDGSADAVLVLHISLGTGESVERRILLHGEAVPP